MDSTRGERRVRIILKGSRHTEEVAALFYLDGPSILEATRYNTDGEKSQAIAVNESVYRETTLRKISQTCIGRKFFAFCVYYLFR